MSKPDPWQMNKDELSKLLDAQRFEARRLEFEIKALDDIYRLRQEEAEDA